MHITIIMVFTYIVCCVRIAALPWRYWQLNARYFSAEAGIFSKQALNFLVPEQWRLVQSVDSDALTPSQYPVFLKPEWGQNSRGIFRADSLRHLNQLRRNLRLENRRYLLQEAAMGKREFELFSIDVDRDDLRHDVLTVTEVINHSERFPINSIYNRNTEYKDISDHFSACDRDTLGRFISAIGQFGISRVSARADSPEDLIAGRFQVIEINLFVPMPINLLDPGYTWAKRWKFIKSAMMCLARATKNLEPQTKRQPIFLSMLNYGKDHRVSDDQKTSTDLRSQGTQSWESAQ